MRADQGTTFVLATTGSTQNSPALASSIKFYDDASKSHVSLGSQKNIIAKTVPMIATAFKVCISHTKKGFLNRQPAKVSLFRV
jgi:hypothetical protein